MAPDSRHPDAAHDAAEVVLREQRLSVTTVRVPTERIVLRRRIVTEVRQLEVTLQREELEVQRLPLDPQDTAGRLAAPGVPAAPLVIVLSEQVPVVQLQTRPYQRVTVCVEAVAGEQQVHEQVSREQAEVTQPDGEVTPR